MSHPAHLLLSQQTNQGMILTCHSSAESFQQHISYRSNSLVPSGQLQPDCGMLPLRKLERPSLVTLQAIMCASVGRTWSEAPSAPGTPSSMTRRPQSGTFPCSTSRPTRSPAPLQPPTPACLSSASWASSWDMRWRTPTAWSAGRPSSVTLLMALRSVRRCHFATLAAKCLQARRIKRQNNIDRQSQ